ncbi:MAG: Mut7-C RNAse domain-containing protein [Actinobacteria bacterium]|nr:Mut7-C RNAse domain-containing protein [Actinomycetota bacterium]
MRTEEPPRLIVDAMLGRLAKKLRLLGIDAAYHRGSDRELFKRALTEKRIVVTKDTDAVRTKAAKSVLSILIPKELNDYRSQTSFLINELKKLGFKTYSFFGRCSLCNSTLIQVKKISASKIIPSYVYLYTGKKIKLCPVCLRAYWEGTHFKKFTEDLKVVMERSEEDISNKQVQNR